MTYEFHATRGRVVGSVIRMGGCFPRISLFVEEIVTERTPPTRKLWKTRGQQRMLVINSYIMAFQTRLIGEGTRVRIFIYYKLPQCLPWRWLGRMFAPLYARWCVSQTCSELCFAQRDKVWAATSACEALGFTMAAAPSRQSGRD